MESLATEANLIALGVFIAVGGLGIIIAQALATRGDRASALKRRLGFAAARNGEDAAAAENDLKIDHDVFGDGANGQRNMGRIATIQNALNEKLSLVGGLPILRKAVPIAAGIGFVSTLAAISQMQMPFKYSMALGLFVFLFSLVMGLKIYVQKTYDKFSALFPDAIDLVVRSIRAGLPVSQALENIGNDIAAPVGPGFARIANEIRIGVSIDDSLHGALKRINLPEMRFFAVTLILQRETGGQLAEVLLNLSDTLRQRKAMKLKIKALTSESRAASKIVAAIPVLAAVAMYYLNREHVMLLVETPVGQNMLMYCVGSVFVGLGIINQLTSVDA